MNYIGNFMNNIGKSVNNIEIFMSNIEKYMESIGNIINNTRNTMGNCRKIADIDESPLSLSPFLPKEKGKRTMSFSHREKDLG